jgi:hypothetical protein
MKKRCDHPVNPGLPQLSKSKIEWTEGCDHPANPGLPQHRQIKAMMREGCDHPANPGLPQRPCRNSATVRCCDHPANPGLPQRAQRTLQHQTRCDHPANPGLPQHIVSKFLSWPQLQAERSQKSPFPASSFAHSGPFFVFESLPSHDLTEPRIDARLEIEKIVQEAVANLR